MRRAATSHGSSGQSLVEVMIAGIIFLFGYQAAVLGFGLANRQQLQAEHMRAAMDIATNMRIRLAARGDDSCLGAGVAKELTRDVDPGNGLACLGNDVNPSPVARCPYDHPRTNQEMDEALGIERGGVRPVYRYDNATPWDVAYGSAGPYRAVWNVQCTVVNGIATAKKVQIMVAWPPLANAFDEGRFINISYSPGDTAS